MRRTTFLPALRLGSVVLVLAAIVAQAVVLADVGGHGGYGQVAVVVVAILVGFIAISAAILAVGNARSRGQTTG